MTSRVTRSQTGATPRKTTQPGFVETPGPRGRPRKAIASDTFESPSASASAVEQPSIKLSEPIEPEQSNGHANGHAKVVASSNGSAKAPAMEARDAKKISAVVKDYKYAPDQEIEFGGAAGVTAIMIGFPVLMWYMWLGATYYDGGLPSRAPGESVLDAIKRNVGLVYEGAFPHASAWIFYWVFLVVQGAFYLLMPGIYSYGKPLEHLGGKQLPYYCSAWASFYTSIAIAAVLHVTGLFPLYTILDQFGPLLSVAIISGVAVSFVAYFSALFRGAQHRMSGNHIYDFFVGAELNPRLFGLLDFKMFFEVRLPWFMLFFISAAAAARQYERYGYVSGEVAFLLMAHWLYANACCKAEELIVTTWDMYYEKWGFMLIFWNMAGVPLSYCHCTIYLANHDPSTYAWPKWFLVFLFTSYLFVYWVWDTCNSQKNMFRMRERGTAPQRSLPPQLPWKEVGPNPRVIPTATGDSILADGWYGKARKIHYACDMYFAFTWGLITGFNSPFPWFYPVFFACMITHRAIRDIHKCRERYGDAWKQYEKEVPYLFIPYVF